jgi:hypothetical protein
MRRWMRLGLLVFVTAGLAILQTPSTARAAGEEKQSVSVAFGRGLNTNQAMNAVNHVMLPGEVKVDHGGVVHFLVAGFHQPVLYKPGTQPEDIAVPPSGTFINDLNNLYYEGISPAGGPLGTPATPVVPGDTRSNAANRVESVSFPETDGIHPVSGMKLSDRAEPGVYLVICNIRGHFLDGMFGFIEVKAKEDN